MAIMLPSARRKDGEEQPFVSLGLFKLRLPFVHAPWEIPEMIQAMVVFVTGASATAYLQDIFGLPFAMALSIICIHELLYALQNVFGDPIVGGWITPAIPLITPWLASFADYGDRVSALITLQILLGILYIILGLTGVAGRLVDWVPSSVKAGILIGAGISAVIGKYGFQQEVLDSAGNVVKAAGTFYSQPIAFSVGVLVSLFFLFSNGFTRLKAKYPKGLIGFLAKSGFVPALLVAYIVGMITGEIPTPMVDLKDGIFFNPIPGILGCFGIGEYGEYGPFNLISRGLPSLSVIMATIPMVFICYIISFGDIVAGTEFIRDADDVRRDEVVDVNANRTNVMCGIRNIAQGLFLPTVTMSGPLWSAMMVTIAERYKTGKENMYSLFGGVITFNITKVCCCFIIPLLALVKPILPLSMSLTLMIQAFGCFYVALGMCKNNVQRGVAGVIGGILAVTDPQTGLIAGIIISILVEFLFSKDRNGNGKNMKKEG